MKNTTLCYIEENGSYLMLHRVKKDHDENRGKWIGVGGKCEEGESPDDCVRREVLEETGLSLKSARMRGIITFVSDEWGTEYMFLYEASAYPGVLKECSEGDLAWIKKESIENLNLWEGDRIFLRLLQGATPFFSLKLVYRGGTLLEAILDGEPIQ